MYEKEVELRLHLVFTVNGDGEEEAKEDCSYFMQWVREQFTQWDESILQYFLYEYNLTQDGRYTLDLHIDKVEDNGGADETTAAEPENTTPVEAVQPEVDDNNKVEVTQDNFNELHEDAQDHHLRNTPISDPKVPRPGSNVEVANPVEQMHRLVKHREKKKRNYDRTKENQ